MRLSTTLVLLALLTITCYAGSGLYPRSEHICDSEWGFYWDGQKCEVCADNCYCDGTVLGCDKCRDGHGMF